MSASTQPRLGHREHLRLARLMDESERTRRRVQPLTRSFPGITLADAYAVRDALVERRIAAGERAVGAIVALDRDRPSIGWLTDGMVGGDGRPSGIRRRGIAAVVAWPLGATAVTPESVRSAAVAIHACTAHVSARSTDVIDDVAANLAVDRLELAPPAEHAVIDGDLADALTHAAVACSDDRSPVAARFADERSLTLVVMPFRAPEPA